jgi:uncharacterized MAPEG superfamily protein
MNQLVLTVLIAGLLPIVCASIAKRGGKNYDNHNPRAWMSQLEGSKARADAAQQNSFEAFPLFAAAVVLALLSDVDAAEIAPWCWAFVAVRVAYIYCYVTDRSTPRSIFWTLGLASVIRIFVLAM